MHGSLPNHENDNFLPLQKNTVWYLCATCVSAAFFALCLQTKVTLTDRAVYTGDQRPLSSTHIYMCSYSK